jgi:hypothetical protein
VAVTFTANIGLAKPTESELALNWARTQKLAEDNNNIIIDKFEFPSTAYTPTIIGPTTNPAVGAGQIKGSYQEFQGFVWGDFNMIFTDPGVSAGSGAGAYGISLPVNADNSYYAIGTALTSDLGFLACIGEGYFGDVGTIGNNGTVALDIVRIAGVDYMRMITEAYAGKTAKWVGPTIPSTISTGDHLSGSFIYKKTP